MIEVIQCNFCVSHGVKSPEKHTSSREGGGGAERGSLNLVVAVTMIY